MALQNIPLGGTTKENLEKINSNFGKVLATDNNVEYTPTSDYQPATKKYVDDSMSGAGLGDMLKQVYDQDNDGIVDNAEKVDHTLTVKINSGTTEGNSQYTFDGSATKSLDIKAGSNVSITTANGEATIAATDTVTRINTSSTPANVNVSSSLASGDITLGEAAAKQVSATIPASPTEAQQATLPTLSAVKSYVDGATTGNRYYKGTIAGGSTGSYGALTPAADSGDVYVVSTAGKINGINVEPNDTLICNTDNTAAATSSNYSTIANNWNIVQGNVDGVVVSSEASVTSGDVPIYDGTTGKILHSSGFTLGKSVPANAVFTDTVPIKTTFDDSTNWSISATNGVYTLSLTIPEGRYPVAVYNSSGNLLMVGINIVSATSISIESYSKFAGYVILV